MRVAAAKLEKVVLRLFLGLPLLVVCAIVEPPLPDTTTYGTEGGVCVDGSAMVSVDGLQESVMGCGDATIPAATNIVFRNLSRPVMGSVCIHVLPLDLANPASCEGETDYLVEYGVVTMGTRAGVGFFDIRSTSFATAVTPHVSDGFVATASASCDGGTVGVIDPVAGLELNLLNASGSCEVTFSMDSQAQTAGATFHTATVVFQPTQECSSDGSCPSGVCGPMGLCQTGEEGDRCANPFDCANGNRCVCDLASDPTCFIARCFDGSAGDPCLVHDDCASLACVADVCQ